MGCMLGLSNDKFIDINSLSNEQKNQHIIIQNQQQDFNIFLSNEMSSINNTVQTINKSNSNGNSKPLHSKKITFYNDNNKSENNSFHNKTSQLMKSQSIIDSKEYLSQTLLIMKLKNESDIEFDKITITNTSLVSETKNINIIKEELRDKIFTFGSSIVSKEDSIFFKGIDYKIEDSNIKPHQFNIEYEDGKFYIKDCKEGNGIFLKINPKLLINENNNKLIFMFNSLLTLKTELKIMTMKFIIYYKNKRFKYDLNEKKIIKVGRSDECDIIISEQAGVSRVQMSFVYNDKTNEFYVYDGNVINESGNGNKQSTNGVWLLINKMEIFDEMIIKTGMTRIVFELKGI
jgi:hypothetical protein